MKVTFDERSSAWCDDMELNRWFLFQQMSYLKDRCTEKGYLYHNEIYEALGVKWDPKGDNPCYLTDSEFEFSIKQTGENQFTITIGA